jgi:predicted ATPase
MFTSLRLQNFKSWRDTGEMRLAPITALFGANSSGKSSILQWLLLLKQTAEASDRGIVLDLGGVNSLVKLGAFEDIVHEHRAELELRSAVRIFPTHPRPNDELNARLPGEFEVEVSVGTRLVGRGRYPVVNRLDYRSCAGNGAETLLAIERAANDRMNYRMRLGGTDNGSQAIKIHEIGAPRGLYGLPFPWFIEEFGQTGEIPAAMARAAGIDLWVDESFARLLYLGPLRIAPSRTYLATGTQPSDVGARGEYTIEALLASADRSGARMGGGLDDQYELGASSKVAEWLKALGVLDAFEIEPIAPDRHVFEVRVRTSPEQSWVVLPDVGFGVSQVLPVLALCAYAAPGSTIILEQPELHLHPSVQAGLADVLIETATQRGVQIILESHSEHLLLRLQRRIAEGTVSNDDVAMYFCRLENGASVADKLDVDEWGGIRNWPDDFFGDSFGETEKRVRAGIKRKKVAAQT